MKVFMDADFLLETPTAHHLYHDFAAAQPIVDYHCHISPQEIYENRKFENITQLWLGGDHYKWRVMRSNGVPERFITGDASDREKFQKFAETLPLAIGNPMYHWCHLELRRYFGYKGILNADTAEQVWNLCNDKLQNDDSFRVRGLIARSNVCMIGTTDDPIDTLEWHKLLADEKYNVKVLPSFRPDKALNAHKQGFVEYIAALGVCVGEQLHSVEDVARALTTRIDYFYAHGCRAADHGLDSVVYCAQPVEEINDVFTRAMAGESLSAEQVAGYQTYLLLACARAYAAHDMVWQIHYSCLRNNNSRRFAQLGADTGFDTIAITLSGQGIAQMLDALDATEQLPKTVLYSLNPADNAMLGTMLGAFQGEGVAGKIQHGSAWWFNDHRTGMEEQLTSLGNLGLLGNFIGMLTDSRSFLSYTRHEYFRRILCNYLGRLVENGEYPADDVALSRIVEGICAQNAIRYFNL